MNTKSKIHLTTVVIFLYFSYKLFALTLFHADHYTAALKIEDQWYSYDGLKERDQTGSGLTPISELKDIDKLLSCAIYVIDE